MLGVVFLFSQFPLIEIIVFDKIFLYHIKDIDKFKFKKIF